MAKVSEYRRRLGELLTEMQYDEDVSYQEMLHFITVLAEQSLNNIDAMAGVMAPMIKETIGVYRR